MATGNLYENVGKLITFSFISSLSIGFALFFYAVFNDYIYYNLNLAVITLENSGLLGSWVNTFMVTMQDTVLVLIPNLVDLLWVFAFISTTIAFLVSAYYTKREGYFSGLAFLTYGMMAVLFILGIFTTLSEWFQVEFVGRVLPNLVYATPFFNLYLKNVGLINAILIACAIVLNFVDLEITKFKVRKDIDLETSEIN